MNPVLFEALPKDAKGYVKRMDLPKKKTFDFDLMALRTIIGPKLHTLRCPRNPQLRADLNSMLNRCTELRCIDLSYTGVEGNLSVFRGLVSENLKFLA